MARQKKKLHIPKVIVRDYSSARGRAKKHASLETRFFARRYVEKRQKKRAVIPRFTVYFREAIKRYKKSYKKERRAVFAGTVALNLCIKQLKRVLLLSVVFCFYYTRFLAVRGINKGVYILASPKPTEGFGAARNDLIAYLHYKKTGRVLRGRRSATSRTEKVEKLERRVIKIALYKLFAVFTAFSRLVYASKKYLPSSQTAIALLIIIALVLSNFTSFFDHSSVQRAEAASSTFVQTDWSGSASTTQYGVHPTNQTGWTNYSSKDATLANFYSTDLRIATSTGSTTHTSDTDWNTGTVASTSVSGTGSAADVTLSSVAPAPSACSGTDHAGADWTPTGTISGDHCNVGVFTIGAGTVTIGGTLRVFSSTTTITGTLNGNGQGNAAGTNYFGDGVGTGKGYGQASFAGSGAGYGGAGGNAGSFPNVNPGGVAYGSSTAPTDVGSSGGNGDSSGSGNGAGGAGGGAVFIRASETLTINGTITVNGSDGAAHDNYPGGAGSGGSIWLETSTFTGAGSITSYGGSGGAVWVCTSCYGSGGGAGGRIAIYYASKTYTGVVAVSGGTKGTVISGTAGVNGSAGTIVQTQVTTSGTITSAPINLGHAALDFTTIAWTETLPTNTDITFQLAHSADGSSFSSFLGPDGTTGTSYTTNSGETIASVFSGKQYIKYKATLTTTDLTATPTLSDLTINHEYYATSTSPTLTFSYYDSGSTGNVLSSIAWSETLGYGGDVKFQVRTAPDSSGSPGTATSFCGPNDASTTACTTSTYFTDPTGSETIDNIQTDGANDQWVQLKLTLSTTSSTSTPVLSDLTLTYVVNAPPQFNPAFDASAGATASQNTTTSVAIAYAIRDPDTGTGTNTPNYISPTFEYSTNGGSSWTTAASTTFAVGDTYNKSVATTTYNTYEATWDAESIGALANVYSTTTQIRITANDNEAANNTAATTTANFTLDTKEPTLSAPTGGGTGINANQNTTTTLGNDKIASTSVTLQLSSADDQALQMKISNTSDCSSGTYEAYASTKAWTLASGEGTKNISAQFRDPVGNVSACASDTITLDTTAPAAPANIAIQEVSNANTAESRLFVSWGVIADPGDFASYRVYRSTDSGTTYTLVSTITARATNSYTDTAVNNSTTYTYLVNAVDDINNISASSTSVSLKPGSNPVDTIAPTVSGAASSTITASSAHITWTTNEVADSAVQYSTDTSYGTAESITSDVTSHDITLKGLAAGTKYNYRIKSCDPSGNCVTTATSTLTTLAADTTAPTISNIASSAAPKSATITWNTSGENANSFVEYSTTSGFTSGTAFGSYATTTSHSVTLPNVLSFNTTYYYRVRSKDIAGNEAISSENSFTTQTDPSDISAPQISAVATSSIAYNTGTVTWTTSETASSFVEFGKTTSYGEAAGQYDSVASHSVSLPKTLDAATQYHFRVRSTDPSGNEGTSRDYTFTTSANPSDATSPTISGISIREPTQTSVIITWRTNEDADSYIGYSKDLSYIKEQGSPQMTQDHSVMLVGLDTASEYFFRVISSDPSGNKAIDDNSGNGHSFVTATSTTSSATISNIRITDVAAHTVTVRWTTSKAASSTVEYGFDTSYGFSAGSFSSATTHVVALPSNLLSNVAYHFRVRSVDSDNNEAVSEDSLFTTASTKTVDVGSTRFLEVDTVSPIPIQVTATDIGSTTAKITWTTAEYASSQVRYGETTAYGATVGDLNAAVAAKKHAFLLEGLSPDTTYNYEAWSQDSSGNIGRSGNFTITTLPAKRTVRDSEETLPPPVEDELEASDTEPPKIEQKDAEVSTSKLLERVEAAAKIAREEIAKVEDEVDTEEEKEDVFAEVIKAISREKSESARRRATQEALDDLSESSARTIFANSFSRLAESLSFEQLAASLDRAAQNIVSPPQIAGEYPQAREVTSDSAIIVWLTDKPSNSIVALSSAEDYDPSAETPYKIRIGNAEERVNSHIVEVTGLDSSTLYHFQARSQADIGDIGSSRDRIFTTKSELPRITDISITGITEHTVTLTWNTNISTDTTIEYTNIQTTETFTQGEPALLRAHSFTLENLEFNNTYRLRIKARDEFGNEARTSSITFSTSADDTPPRIFRVRSETAISPQDAKVQAIITWRTDEPATTQVFYQEGLASSGTARLSKTRKDTNLNTNHVVIVTSFKPAAVYKFYAESQDAAGNSARSKDFTILTPRKQQTVVQVIVKNFGETFGFLQKLRL